MKKLEAIKQRNNRGKPTWESQRDIDFKMLIDVVDLLKRETLQLASGEKQIIVRGELKYAMAKLEEEE